ncbi:MAG: hypothetical protein ACLQU2_31215 [Candidatus Binataceae bacterium]
MYSLRTHAKISGGLFLLILVMGWGGTALQAFGVVKHPEQFQTPIRIVFFTIFLVFAFSLVPTMVKLFLAGQATIGNAGKGPIKFLDRHQVGVIWGFWIVWGAGLAIALPTMIRAGFFTDLGGSSSASRADDRSAREIARMPVQGTLLAAPGMTVDQMIRGSSLKIAHGTNSMVPSQPLYAGGAIFNFHVAGTGI